jgi:hypothetical protein
MDSDRLKITAETWAIRGRGWVRLGFRLCGLALVIAGGLNLLIGFPESILPVTIYRGLWLEYTGISAWPLGDLIAIGVGAAIANFV